MGLLQRLEQDALDGVRQPAHVADQRHPVGGDAGLEGEEGLERLLVMVGLAIGKKTDLVDLQAVAAVVLPVVRVPVERSLRQQGLGERPSHSRLADRRLPDEEVGVREPLRSQLAVQQPQHAGVSGDTAEGIIHGRQLG